MIPPEYFLRLHRQRHQEIVRQAEQARLVRASRRKPESAKRVYQPFLWWAGGVLLSWGCALQLAGAVMQRAEKGCCVCL